MAPLAHDGPLWAWPATGASAAQGVQAAIQAVSICRADYAGVEFFKDARSFKARATATGVEDSALVVNRARLAATRSATALVAGQAIHYRLDTHALQTTVVDAGVVVLAAAIAVIHARLLAETTNAALPIDASRFALRLRRAIFPSAKQDRRHRHRYA